MTQCYCQGFCVHVVTVTPPGSSPAVRENVAAANRLRASMRAAGGESGFDALTNEPAPPTPPTPAQLTRGVPFIDTLVRDYANGVTIHIPAEALEAYAAESAI